MLIIRIRFPNVRAAACGLVAGGGDHARHQDAKLPRTTKPASGAGWWRGGRGLVRSLFHRIKRASAAFGDELADGVILACLQHAQVVEGLARAQF